MAVKFDESTIQRGVTEWAAYPEELEVIPELNGRHDLPDISALVDSIVVFGQIQPVTIRKSEGKPVLVAGFSRWRAVAEINKRKLLDKPIKLRCSYTQLTDKQAFLANIEENRVRNQTTPMDDAYNIQRLVNVHQMTEAEVAESYRASILWIRDRLRLLELTPEAEKAVRSGRVAGSAAKAIAKLTKEQQKTVLKHEGKITTKTVREVVPPTPKAARVAAIKDRTALEIGDDLVTALEHWMGEDNFLAPVIVKLVKEYKAAR